MKFGKRIQGIAQDNARFGAYFVDYKQLKKLLKRIPQRSSIPSDDLSGAEEAEDAEERFMLALESEVAKVESFFRSTLADMLCEFRSLCKRVNKLQLETKVAEEFHGFEQLISLPMGTNEADLLKDFVAFSKDVDCLRSFVMTNAQATVKITKKHDKGTEGVQLREHYVSVLQRCTFYNSRDFGALIADIEVLATQLIQKLTGQQPSPDDFQCLICMHVLRNPLVLSCGHRFCNSCISVATYFKQHACPVCRKDMVMDFQNLRVESLLSRFVRDLQHQTQEVEGRGGTGTCILENPCEQCAQWRSLTRHAPLHVCRPVLPGEGSYKARRRSSLVLAAHEAALHAAQQAAQRGRDREAEDVGWGEKKAGTPLGDADAQNRPWTACAEIFRSSKKLLRIGSGGASLFPILSPPPSPAPAQGSKDLSWSRRQGGREEEGARGEEGRGRLVWWWAAAAAAAVAVGCSTGWLASTAAGPLAARSLLPNAALRCEGGGLKGGAQGCEGPQSGVERLQEARTKSLHRALDNLVKSSGKK